MTSRVHPGPAASATPATHRAAVPRTERARGRRTALPVVLFATGSTGGHVAPALSIAEALASLDAPIRSVFAGPAGGIAERMVGRVGGSFFKLEIAPLRGAGPLRLVLGLGSLPAGAIRSIGQLRRLRPALVVGTGAHTSGPLLAFAALAGIPTLLLEPNAEIGLANAWLRPFAGGAAVAFPETLAAFGRKGFLAGCPVGRVFREARAGKAEPASHVFRILVLGGSAGSPTVDHVMLEALPHLGPLVHHLSVVHQASPDDVVMLRAAYARAGTRARVESFYWDLPHHYQEANLVVTRPGAVTLAELAATGRPSVLIPAPSAGNHQLANARLWASKGCGVVRLPGPGAAVSLAETIVSLVEDPSARAAMGHAAKAQDHPDAAADIAARCLAAVRVLR